MSEGAAEPVSAAAWRPFEFSSFDGLRLHAREYGRRLPGATTILCLPGLTRNSKDFHDLAVMLGDERRILALDFRGRGMSGYARRAEDYTPFTEMLDTLALLDAAGAGRVAVVGTSRGGIVAMLLAVARPAAVAAVVLNDIGPHIEPAGLLRIVGYVSHTPAPENWEHATDIVRQINAPAFSGMADEEWQAFARRVFRDVDGRPAADYDPKLVATLAAVSRSKGHVPDLWAQFLSLRRTPTLTVRGENSDILSRETVERMAEAHPAMQSITVKNRGHAPFLDEPGVPRAILRLVEQSEAARPHG